MTHKDLTLYLMLVMTLTISSSEFVSLGGLDQEAFSALVEPHRRAIQAHCYRMLGSMQEAEELVQEAFLRAWQRRETYAGLAPLRSWLYRIATNLCLDALERRPRRTLPIAREEASDASGPIPGDMNEPIWLEPLPDEWLAGEELNPEARYAQQESVALAFITSLQQLPPRQRAVLILRDVLDWQANEVAQFLEVSVPAVKSTLHRARATLGTQRQKFGRETMPARVEENLQEQLARYMRAWEMADVEGLTSLLKEDATFSMPPIPSWYQGRAAIRVLVGRTIFAGKPTRRWKVQATRANGQPAFGLYQWNEEAGAYQAYGVQVLTFVGSELADITTFRVPGLVGRFGLPETILG